MRQLLKRIWYTSWVFSNRKGLMLFLNTLGSSQRYFKDSYKRETYPYFKIFNKFFLNFPLIFHMTDDGISAKICSN